MNEPVNPELPELLAPQVEVFELPADLVVHPEVDDIDDDTEQEG